ncbi:MAG: GIDE domain-containing protein [Steroidobacteraceae bacterium]
MDELLRSPLFWMLLSAAAIPGSFWLALKRMRLARTIADTPTSRVHSAAQGYVELWGMASVAPGGTILAPLTRRRCVWWRYKVEERQRSRDNNRWHTLQQGTSEESFLLSDESGQCVVNPENAEVYPAERRVWFGSTDWPSEQLGTHNVVLGAFQRYRYTEYLIPESVRVNVIGEFRTLGNLAGGDLEEDIGALLRQWKRDQPGLMRRFDANHDGVLSAMEWEQARQAARGQILAEYGKAPAAGPLNMVCAPRDERPFLIAAANLDGIARKARWQAFGCWAVFIGSAGLLTWLLLRL